MHGGAHAGIIGTDRAGHVHGVGAMLKREPPLIVVTLTTVDDFIERKTPAFQPGLGMSEVCRRGSRRAPVNPSGRDARLILDRLAQHIAAAPHRLDVVLAV
jgi:hypothetical protein